VTMTESFKLRIIETGRVIESFSRYDIDLSMHTIGTAFTFSVWSSDIDESAWRALVLDTKLGHRIAFEINEQVVYTGWIETIDVPVNRKDGALLVMSGRDLAALAVDWDVHPATDVRNKPLSEALTTLFAQVGVSVVTASGADAAPVLEGRVARRRTNGNGTTRRNNVVRTNTRPEKGETIMHFAQRMIDKLGFMVWLAPESTGQNVVLVVDKPAYDSDPVFTFERRFTDSTRRVVTATSNILESHYSAQIRNIPTQVSAYGRAPRGDQLPSRTRSRLNAREFLLWSETEYGGMHLSLNSTANTPAAVAREYRQRAARDAARLQQSGVATTSAAPWHRPTATRQVFTNDDLSRFPCVAQPLPPHPRHLHDKRAINPRTGEQAARAVIARSMKDFRRYEVTVRGHSQQVNGVTVNYALNTMARVYDGRAYIDEHMLITDVKYSGSRQGHQETRITLGTRGAIYLEPEQS